MIQNYLITRLLRFWWNHSIFDRSYSLNTRNIEFSVHLLRKARPCLLQFLRTISFVVNLFSSEMSYSYRDQTHFRSSTNEDKFDNQLSAKKDLKRRLFKLGCQVRWGLSPPREAKRRNIAPSKKVPKQSANSWEDAKPRPKKVSKQSANSWEEAKSFARKRSLATQSPSKKRCQNGRQTVARRRKVSRSPKEAKRRIPRPKKCQNSLANSWEDAKSLTPQKEAKRRIPRPKKCQNSPEAREKKQSLSPKKGSQFPIEKGAKAGRKISPKDAKSSPKRKPIPRPNRCQSRPENLAKRLKVSRPNKEAKRRNPRPKKCQNSRQTREKTQSLSPPPKKPNDAFPV